MITRRKYYNWKTQKTVCLGYGSILKAIKGSVQTQEGADKKENQRFSGKGSKILWKNSSSINSRFFIGLNEPEGKFSLLSLIQNWVSNYKHLGENTFSPKSSKLIYVCCIILLFHTGCREGYKLLLFK